MESDRQLYRDLEKIFYTEAEIKAAVKELGQRITRDFAGRELLCVCILKGAGIFFSDLIREIDLPLETDYMVVSSYGASTTTSGEVRIVKDLDCSAEGKEILIIEDIVDTGTTMNYLKNYMLHRGVKSLNIVSLLDKPSRRAPGIDLKVDYSCFEVPDAFVVGYGLDYAQKYRNLPDIGVLSPEVYAK